MNDLARIVEKEKNNFSEHFENHLRRTGQNSSNLVQVNGDDADNGTLYVFNDEGFHAYAIQNSKRLNDGSIIIKEGWISKNIYETNADSGKISNQIYIRRVGEYGATQPLELVTISPEKFEQGLVYKMMR